MIRTFFPLVLLFNFILPSQLNNNNNIAYNIPDPDCSGTFHLCTDNDKERLGRLAIKAIHEQMDDDKDGMIEASETSGFIEEELESKTDVVRHHRFQNADLQITLDDLWNQWKTSAVYNWSTDDVIKWIVDYVHLPMYVENFRRNQIDGRMVPRIAVNDKHYLSSIMQIRDPRHKRRLIIKATDVVLFGPPQRTHNLVKDMILMSALVVAIGACLYAFVRHRNTQESMKRMVKDLEALQKAEGDLIAVTGKMKAMENELKEKVKVDRGLLNTWFMEVQRTKDEAERYRKRRDSTMDADKQLRLAVQEIEQLRIALRKAEEHAQHQSFEAPAELIDLLKRTYHIEESAFEVKRKSAESAMLIAKDQMSKISKMQKGFFGAVRIAHTGCMDNISELISAAKSRLAEVQEEYEEREHRWNRIACLLDREDLISCSSSTSTTTNGLNGPNSTSESTLRTKANPNETNSLHPSLNDSPTITKRNSGMNFRGFSLNVPLPTAKSANEMTTLLENNGENVTIASKRRIFHENALINSSMSSDSANNLLNIDVPRQRANTSDSMDIVAPPKPHFDIVTDLPSDNFDSIETKSQLIPSIGDDQESISSSTKSKKSLRTSKLFKSFSNIRFRKKTSTT